MQNRTCVIRCITKYGSGYCLCQPSHSKLLYIWQFSVFAVTLHVLRTYVEQFRIFGKLCFLLIIKLAKQICKISFNSSSPKWELPWRVLWYFKNWPRHYSCTKVAECKASRYTRQDMYYGLQHLRRLRTLGKNYPLKSYPKNTKYTL